MVTIWFNGLIPIIALALFVYERKTDRNLKRAVHLAKHLSSSDVLQMERSKLHTVKFFYNSFTWVAIPSSSAATRMAVSINSVMFSSQGINQAYPCSVGWAPYPY